MHFLHFVRQASMHSVWQNMQLQTQWIEMMRNTEGYTREEVWGSAEYSGSFSAAVDTNNLSRCCGEELARPVHGEMSFIHQI